MFLSFIKPDRWNYCYYCIIIIIITFLGVTVKMQEERSDTKKERKASSEEELLGKVLDQRQGGQRRYLCSNIKLLAFSHQKGMPPKMSPSLCCCSRALPLQALKDLTRLLWIFFFMRGIRSQDVWDPNVLRVPGREESPGDSSHCFLLHLKHGVITKNSSTQHRPSCLQLLSCNYKDKNKPAAEG